MSKTAEELAQELTEKVDGFKAQIDKAATKEDLDAVKTQLEEMKNDSTVKDLLNEVAEKVAQIEEKTNVSEEKEETMLEGIRKNKEQIKKLINKTSAKEVVIKADTLRASIASNTQSYNLPDITQLAHRKLTLWDLFPKIPISESNNNGTIKYWDWDEATTVRAAAAVAEGAAFPESTAKWAEYTLTLKKIGDTLPVSEEFMEDEAMFAGELSMFLETNVAIKVDTDLANADGTGNNIKGIVSSVDAYTPVASGITDASIYDLLVKVSESITSTGGSKYSPDFVLMNIADINKMKLKKDANNNYIIPPFVSRDGKQVDTIVVVECNAIAANSCVIGDRRYARVYFKPGVELSKGEINAQFVEDMTTLKARKRLAFLIKNGDKGGFAKVTSISAALTTLAT